MAVTFSAQRVYTSIAEKIEVAVTETAPLVAKDAQERAPVRKVFKGSVGRASLQSVEEAAAETHLRTRLGLAPGPVRTQRTQAARVHGMGPRRLLVQPTLDARAGRFRSASGRFAARGEQRLIFNTPLTSRGRYELKTGRATFFSGGKATLGGRLRGEITATPAVVEGYVITALVSSPTPYAKYVEFGTRHNRAQPYMRPALAAARPLFRERLAQALR
jgi:HK97 gp10 family phage protein